MNHRLLAKYPLTLWALQAGSLIGLFVGLLMDSVLLGTAIFVLLAVVGCTWRRNEAPVVPFLLGYQWCAITAGYWYYVFTGIFPTAYALGDLERTVQLSLAGLVTLAAGIRLVRDSVSKSDEGQETTFSVRRLNRLFWFVIVIYGIDYIRAFNTKSFGGLDIPLTILLEFRHVLLMVLWYETIRHGAGRRYLWLSLAWVFIPSLGSYFSDFKTPLILLFLVSLQFWQPWEPKSWKWSIASWTRTIGLLVVALFLMLVWQAGVKKEARRIYDEGLVNGRLDRAELFVKQVAAAVPEVIDDPQPSIEILISRLSYIGFFSRVIEYVPGGRAPRQWRVAADGAHECLHAAAAVSQQARAAVGFVLHAPLHRHHGGGGRHIDQYRLHGRVLRGLGTRRHVPLDFRLRLPDWRLHRDCPPVRSAVDPGESVPHRADDDGVSI
jgi:hypothetical protein